MAFLKTFLKAIKSRVEGDYFIFQTDSRKGYVKRLLVNHESTVVVSNAIGPKFFEEFNRVNTSNNHPDIDDLFISLLVPAADYPHKNLGCIIELSNYMESNNLVFPFKLQFVVCLPSNSNILVDLLELNKIHYILYV